MNSEEIFKYIKQLEESLVIANKKYELFEHKLKPKFNRKQIVYWLKMESIPRITNCDMCSGDGVLLNNTTKALITCPKCNGKQTMSTSGSIKEIVCRGKIKKIIITIASDYNAKLEYEIERLKDEYYDNSDKNLPKIIIHQDNLYQSIEECEKHKSKFVAGYSSY